MSRQPQGKSLSQPTSRVGNLERRRRDAIPVQRGSGSGTQRTLSGSSHSTRTLPAESSSSHGTQSSGRSSSPPQTTGRPTSGPVKRARRRTLQTTVYSVPEGEPDAQQQIVFVTGRGGAGFHSPDPALTRGRGGYVSGNPRPAPVRGLPALIPWTGPRLLPPIFNGDPSGVCVGRGPERGQGEGMPKKAPRPRPLSGAGRGKGPGARVFRGPVRPVTNSNNK